MDGLNALGRVMRTLRRGSLYLALGAVFAVLATLADAAIAQSGPLVRIIVPFPPGGSADVLARVLSQQIEKTTKQTTLSKSIDIKRRHTDVERLPSRQRGIALSGLDIQATSGIAGNTQPNPATT